jgi:hypothetical protein
MIKRLALALLVQVSAMYAGQAYKTSYTSPILGMDVPYLVILPHSYAQDVAQGIPRMWSHTTRICRN